MTNHRYQKAVWLSQTTEDPVALQKLTKTQTKQIFFPTYTHPPPNNQQIIFFQSHKRHKQVARRHEWSVPRWAHSLALVSDLSSIQVMTVGPLRPVLSWIWDIFSAMAMRGLSTAWKRRKKVCEQLMSVTGGTQDGFLSKHLDSVPICDAQAVVTGHPFSGPRFPLL